MSAAPATASSTTPLQIPQKMKAWVLGRPHELKLVEKPVPQPREAEVLVRIGAIAVCGTDLEVISHGEPALVQGGLPFDKNFTPGHEYMGTVVKLGPGVDEFAVGERVAVEIHAGCGRCERCREGMYTACTNYGMNYAGHDKGHRANGFTTDGGFAEYAINHINTMVRVPAGMSDEEATLIVTAGTATYGLDVLGGLIAGQTVVVTGPGPIGLMSVGVAKALGASPVILVGTRQDAKRMEIGRQLGADASSRRRRRPGCGGQAHHRRQRRALRDGMFGRAQCGKSGRAHGQPRRPHLPRRICERAGAGRHRLHRQQQHLSVRHPRRRQERDAARRLAARAKTFFGETDPHAHVFIRPGAGGDPAVARTHRRCDQSRRQNVSQN